MKTIIELGSHIWARAWPPAFDAHKPNLKVTRELYQKFVRNLLPGDVILNRSSGYLGNLFVPGLLKHVGIYTGKSFDEVYSHAVVQAVQPEVSATELWGFLAESAAVQVFRSFPALPLEHLDIVCKRAKNTVNKRKQYDYDYLSVLNTDKKTAYSKFYCSELVVFAYQPFRGTKLDFYSQGTYGQAMYVPDTFVRLGTGWELVLDA